MTDYFNDIYMFDTIDGYYIYIAGRNSGKSIYTISRYLEFLFGGTCEYQFEPCSKIHHYLIKNDDIGFIDMTVTNECFVYENINVHVQRMCEEYDSYMRYKYRDYIAKEKENVKNK